MRLIYGFDPLCGWCFGFVPAMREMRRVYPDLPVTLAMPGLVIGDRVGPYSEKEGYIRTAGARLQAVTGRMPSEAFFDLIRRPGVRGDSGPPIAAIAMIARIAPEAGLAFAHAVTEAHFRDGADLNDPGTYRAIAAGLGLGEHDFDLEDTGLIAATQAAGRDYGIASFPTLILESGDARFSMPSLYDPAAVLAWLGRAMATA